MKNELLESEVDIIQRCIKGDRKAQFVLYHRYAKAMLNVAFRILNEKEEAKDVLQMSFLKAFTNLNRLKNHQGFGGWLKKIVVNTSINQLKKKGLNWMELSEQIIQHQEDKIEENPVFGMEQAKKALMQLPSGYRTVLSLYLIEGYDHEEIAKILDISVSTSLSQYARGKKKLKLILKNSNGD